MLAASTSRLFASISTIEGGILIVYLEAYRIPEATLPNCFFDGFQQIISFQFLDRHFGVARHMEQVSLNNLQARKKMMEIGNQQLLDRNEALDSGIQAVPRSSGLLEGISARESGTFTRAKCSCPPASRTSRQPNSDSRLEMCGNGRPGSKASGVSTGKTLSMKIESSCARCSESIAERSTRWMLVALSAVGNSRSRRKSYASSISLSTSVLIASKVSAGLRPSIPGFMHVVFNLLHQARPPGSA